MDGMRKAWNGNIMTVQDFPNKGDKLFLMHKEVVVIKVYSIFRLIKIRYREESFEFFVDASALSTTPDFTNSISIRMLRRELNEQYHASD
jgi:hypothetical protein